MIVTVLPCDGMVPGTTNGLQVIAEIQETRSTSSVFGFRFSFSRLPSGSRRHESPPVAARAVRGVGDRQGRAGPARSAAFRAIERPDRHQSVHTRPPL